LDAETNEPGLRANERFLWSRAALVRRKAHRSESRGASFARHVSRHLLTFRWTGGRKPGPLRVSPVRVSTHSILRGPPRLGQRAVRRFAADGARQRGSSIGRPPSPIDLDRTPRSPRGHRPSGHRARADRKEGHVSGGIRSGSTGARGTRRLLKSKRGILLAPGVSTKEEASNAKGGSVRRPSSSGCVAAR
jgi:hypothetical protein